MQKWDHARLSDHGVVFVWRERRSDLNTRLNRIHFNYKPRFPLHTDDDIATLYVVNKSTDFFTVAKICRKKMYCVEKLR